MRRDWVAEGIAEVEEYSNLGWMARVAWDHVDPGGRPCTCAVCCAFFRETRVA